MENLSVQLEQQIKELEALLNKIDKSLSTYKVSDKMSIKLCKKKTGYQYYKEDKNGKRIYIRKSDRDKVRKSFQFDYYESLRKVILTQRYRIERFLKLYDITAIDQVFNDLCEGRKQLVTPISESTEDFITRWYIEHPGGLNTFPEDGIYVTENGEQVRSKSEKILADLFLKHKIPYVYEPRVELSNGYCVYPDFILLNTRTRKTYYWEHLGLITEDDYATRALQKIYAYEKDGIVIGENLILSMESPDMPLDIKLIKDKLEKMLL